MIDQQNNFIVTETYKEFMGLTQMITFLENRKSELEQEGSTNITSLRPTLELGKTVGVISYVKR